MNKKLTAISLSFEFFELPRERFVAHRASELSFLQKASSVHRRPQKWKDRSASSCPYSNLLLFLCCPPQQFVTFGWGLTSAATCGELKEKRPRSLSRKAQLFWQWNQTKQKIFPPSSAHLGRFWLVESIHWVKNMKIFLKIRNMSVGGSPEDAWLPQRTEIGNCW